VKRRAKKAPFSGSPASERPDLLAWAQRFLPEHFSDKPCEFHRELMHDLCDPPRRLLARVAPRGHAKSTCAALALPLWCVCEQRRRNIVIVTHELSLSRQFVRDIRHELETNERVIDAYGELLREPEAPRPARGRARRTAGIGAAGQAMPRRRTSAASRRVRRTDAVLLSVTGVSVQARSVGGSFRGLRVGAQRPDLVICDDIEKDALVESPEGRRRLEHWLRRVVMPAMAPDGRLVVVGSILHYDSLLANLRDRRRFPCWDYRVYRALEAEPDEDGRYHLKALWPARWPVVRLEEERERVGTLAFEQEYQANPVDDSLRVFRSEWLRRYEPGELVPERLATLMAVDPATGATGGDYFALWVGSIDTHTGVIYTRELRIERIGVIEQIRRILEAFERWRPVKIGIETVAYQAALQQFLDEQGRRTQAYLPIVPIRTTGNKRARIEGSAPFYENGTFRLPKVLDPEIESQFLHFPKARHDDAPDVCAMGIELARTLRAGREIEIRVARPQSAERPGPVGPARARGW
jgi:predicted phage terminase large subunit-like protein